MATVSTVAFLPYHEGDCGTHRIDASQAFGFSTLSAWLQCKCWFSTADVVMDDVHDPLLSGDRSDAAASAQRQPPPDPLRPRTWLRVDEDGSCRMSKVNRRTFVQQYGVPYRDLRILDPLLPTLFPTALFVRKQSIVVNFESLRLLIFKDHAFVLQVPKAHALSQGATPEASTPFVKQLSARLHAADLDEDAHSVQSSNSMNGPGGHMVDTELPFELRVLEAALDLAGKCFGEEVAELEKLGMPMLDSIAKQVTRNELELLRDLRMSMTRLLARVARLKQELEDILNDDSEMAAMYLGRRAEKEQHGQGATADSASRVESLAEAFAPHEDPVSASAGASGRDPNAEPLADSVPEDTPQQDDDRDLHSLWRTTTSRVITILDTVQSLKQASELDPNNVWACANLLDSHLMQIDFLFRRLEGFQERLVGTENFIARQLDHRRNELVAMDLCITAVMTAFAFVSMIAGIFGMNLRNAMEESHAAFLTVSWSSLALALLAFISMLAFAIRKRLLAIPDLQR